MFNGFFKETTEFYIQLMFNNNKEWFHANKHIYNEYVKTPLADFANAIYDNLHEFDKTFLEVPKLVRANRDIRFSKNKDPYKVSAWFFLRKDQTPGVKHPYPTFFFEITTNGYLYGMFFSPNSTQSYAKMRELFVKNEKKTEKLIKFVEKQKTFEFSGEQYKKNFSLDKPEKLKQWLQMKEFIFIKKCENDKVFYEHDLINLVTKDFIEIFDVYKYFYKIAVQSNNTSFDFNSNNNTILKP